MSTCPIYGDVRVWADRHKVHKMGWLREGDVIDILNEYHGWYRFIPHSGCADLVEPDAVYAEYFVKAADMVAAPEEQEPGEDPLPTEISDAQLGAAFRILVNFIFGR